MPIERLNDRVDVKAVIANSVSSTTLVSSKIDTTGFGRARFIFSFGGTAGIGRVDANAINIWKASTSGGTYSSIASATLAAISSGVLSAGQAVAVIDLLTDSANPWLQVSGSVTSSNLHHSAVVELYSGINLPPTSSANQVVTV
jgi:hypothetical protein